jgi:hypothetical protein
MVKSSYKANGSFQFLFVWVFSLTLGIIIKKYLLTGTFEKRYVIYAASTAMFPSALPRKHWQPRVHKTYCLPKVAVNNHHIILYVND